MAATPPATSSRVSNPDEPYVRTRRRPWYRRLVREELGVLAVLALLLAGVGIAHPEFLRVGNLFSTAQNATYVGLMACGMVFALTMREVDLSVGGLFAMGIVVGAVLIRAGLSPWLAAVIVLAVSALLGSVNGLLTAHLKLPSFIVTLATAMLFRGVGLALADGKQIGDLPETNSFFTIVGGDVLGVPFGLLVLLAAVVVLAIVFTRTRFGGRVRAIGSNPEAAAFTGIPMLSTRVQALTLSGLMAGLAAVLQLAFSAAADPSVGQGYELTAIAACIIGGTPLKGGRGSVVGAVAGCFILTAVSSALVFFEIPINWTTFATGAVILVAVAVDVLIRRLRNLGKAGSS
jgi:ribose/xylose/arabinose/galactoside ABC-type transport system permease subunit